MSLYKAFRVDYVHPSTLDVIKYGGTHVLSFMGQSGSISAYTGYNRNGVTNVKSRINAKIDGSIFSTIPYYETLDNTYTISNITYSVWGDIVEILNATQLDAVPDSRYKIKLVASNGSYALSVETFTGTPHSTGFKLYDNNGTLLGTSDIPLFSYYNGDNPEMLFFGITNIGDTLVSNVTINEYTYGLSVTPGNYNYRSIRAYNKTLGTITVNWLNDVTSTPPPIPPEGFEVTYDLVNCTGDADNPTVIPENAAVTNFLFIPDSGYSFNSGSCWIDGDGYPSGTPIQFVFDSDTGGLRVGPISSDIVVHVHPYIDPYNNPDNPDLIDGEDDIPNADIINVPSLPGIGAVSSGMIGLFNPTAAQMQLLADYMWTDFGGTGSTTEDILKEIVQAIKRAISNPLDYVIGLNIIPSQGLSVGSSTSVRFGFVNSNVSMPRLTSQYFVVDCGSLSFDKLCGDTFLDYAPYSKFSLYLPYIGVKDMDANDFVGHTISILYHGDVVTGGVTAYVLKDGSVMYQYSGCCALTVPMNADSWGTTISGAIQIATALIGSHAISSAGKGFSAKRAEVMGATGAANIASNPSLLSPQVSRSGAISGGAGCMASQKPFVIREAVRFHTTEGYNTITGYPSYYYKPLSSMHGFTSVLDVHLHGIPGTHQELAEIEDLLKEGVIL